MTRIWPCLDSMNSSRRARDMLELAYVRGRGCIETLAAPRARRPAAGSGGAPPDRAAQYCTCSLFQDSALACREVLSRRYWSLSTGSSRGRSESPALPTEPDRHRRGKMYVNGNAQSHRGPAPAARCTLVPPDRSSKTEAGTHRDQNSHHGREHGLRPAPAMDTVGTVIGFKLRGLAGRCRRA